MVRTKGARNTDYAVRRAALAQRLRTRLATRARHASLRELAAAAGVSLPTLRHYFGDREALIEAVFEDHLRQGQAHLARAAAPSGPFDKSIRDFLAYAALGMREGGLALAHAAGLAEGLAHPQLGPAYLRFSLEPLLGAVEQRLAAHQARGEMRPADVRHAALMLTSPLVLAFLHQDALGGSDQRPLDAAAMLADHADAFIRAFSS